MAEKIILNLILYFCKKSYLKLYFYSYKIFFVQTSIFFFENLIKKMDKFLLYFFFQKDV